MHLLNRSVHSENLRFSPKCTLHNMDYRQKMVVASTQKHINDDDDDEDLEALRLAALQSLRAKDTIQTRPQPLPPVQTIIQTNTLPPRGFYKAQRPPARRAFYPHRQQRQNGGQFFQISCNPNLITIVPVEENPVLQQSETPSRRKFEEASTLEKNTPGESKFCRYKDDASASEEEDDGDNRNDMIVKTKSEGIAEKDVIDPEEESTDKENQSAPEESPQRSENEEDDDDVLLMADLEEEDSLERLMDEMEREMNVDKPAEEKEKKPVKKDSREPTKKDSRVPAKKDIREPAKKDSREHAKKDRELKQNEETDRTQKERTTAEQGRNNRSSTPTAPCSPSSSFSKNEQRPLSPYNLNRPNHKRRSLSPKLRSRKKSPRRSPRRSPVRLIKKSQREPLRYRSPRKTPPRFSPRPRSPRLSPRLRSPRLSPRRSPNRSPPRRSPLRLSPRKLSPRSRSPRLSPRPRSPRGPRSRSPRLSPRPRSPRLPRSRSPRLSPRPRSPRLPRSRSPRLSPRRSPMRLSPRARSPKLSRSRSPRLSPRRFTDRPRSPRMSPRRISPRMRSPRLSPRRLSPRPRSPRLSPRRLSPRSRSPRLSPRRISPRPRSPRLSPHRSPWSSPRNSPRLSPRRRRSPKWSPKELPRRTRPRSITPVRSASPSFKRDTSPSVRAKKSPEPLRSKIKQREEPAEKVTVTNATKDSSDVITDPVLEARRRKFECTKPIDPITANKKIKLSKKDNSNKKVEPEGTENLAVNVRKVSKDIEEYETVDTELYLEVEYDIENLEEPVDDSSVATVANSVNVCTDVEPAKLERDKPSKKKKKKDKEIYQVNKLKGELPLSERIGKDKKCKKRKDVATDSPNEEADVAVEDVPVDEEGDLRAELSRRRAERLNRAAPTHQQSARLLQSAFKGVVNEVAKSNAKVNRRQMVKSDDKSNQKGVRRVTVLHRPASDLHDSEDETPLDSKVPVRFRLGLNKAVQDIRESKVSRKNSKRQGRKE